MTDQEMHRTSEDVIKDITELKNSIKRLQESMQPLSDKLSELHKEEKNLADAYERTRKQRITISNEIDDIKYRMGQNPQRLRILENEYARLRDQEDLAKRLQEDIDVFRNKCLEASWRKENRDDNEGALKHQIEGAIQLAVAKQGYCFDKRGLGKTLLSLIWADMLDINKLLIITPNEVASQYVGEVVKWTKHRNAIPFYQQSPKMRDIWFERVIKHIPQWTIVTNVESWRKDMSIVEKFNELQPDAIIVDEAHCINKTDMKQWKGVWHIRAFPNLCLTCGHNKISYADKQKMVVCNMCGHNAEYSMHGQYKEEYSEWQSVKNILLMTGTPILNRPQEFFALGRIVEPQNFYSESNFLQTYCQHQYGGRWAFRYGGQDALIKQIGERVVMRDRKSAGIEIPPQKVQVYELEFDYEKYPKQARALEQIKNYAQLVLDDAGENVMNMTAFITVLLRLRQGIVWPAGIVLKRFDENKELIDEQPLQVYESIKMDWTIDMIRELVLEGERVIVFSQFKEPLRELQRRLDQEWKDEGVTMLPIPNVIYDGDTPYNVREEIKRDFDPKTCGEDPKWKVLLGNYKAAGVGLNLHAATQMILLDEEWNPGKEDQAMGRIDRLGTTKQTTVHIPRVSGSIDDWMAALISGKSETIGGFDDAVKIRTSLLDDIRKGKLL